MNLPQANNEIESGCPASPQRCCVLLHALSAAMQEHRMHQQEQKCLANAITPWQTDACFAACQIPGDRARSLFTWNRGVTRLALQNDR